MFSFAELVKPFSFTRVSVGLSGSDELHVDDCPKAGNVSPRTAFDLLGTARVPDCIHCMLAANHSWHYCRRCDPLMGPSQVQLVQEYYDLQKLHELHHACSHWWSLVGTSGMTSLRSLGQLLEVSTRKVSFYAPGFTAAKGFTEHFESLVRPAVESFPPLGPGRCYVILPGAEWELEDTCVITALRALGRAVGAGALVELDPSSIPTTP